jgi:MinD superfamily P-loop ATPase
MTNNRNIPRQLVILSGKGGTGKTSLAASLMHISSQSKYAGVYVDADVDAANLALVTTATALETHPYWGSQSASIDPVLCNHCGNCYQVCRFEAINQPNSQTDIFSVNELLCEGCAACMYACPQSAIKMNKQQDGEWYHSTTPFGHLFHAELFPGAENSGKLVTTVKQNAKLFAEDHHLPLIIVDGPPGIGCPVISASAGADLALLVAEPGVSGLHDLERIIQTLNHFKIPILICINKADIYPQGAHKIETYAMAHGYAVTGQIPYDDAVPQSIVNAQPITQYASNSPVSLAVSRVWVTIRDTLFTGNYSGCEGIGG